MKTLTKTQTGRGFDLYEFHESGGDLCTLQKSSAMEEDYIWLGAKHLVIKGFMPYHQPDPWQTVSEKDIKDKFGFQDILGNNRMHLSRNQVAALLPILQKFVETGDI